MKWTPSPALLFLPVAAISSVIPDRKNEYYKTDEDCTIALAEAIRVEYKMITDAGLLVQLDDARCVGAQIAATDAADRAEVDLRLADARHDIVLETEPEGLGHALDRAGGCQAQLSSVGWSYRRADVSAGRSGDWLYGSDA